MDKLVSNKLISCLQLAVFFTLCMQVDGVAWAHKAQRQNKSKVVSRKVEKNIECPDSRSGSRVIKQKGEASYYGKQFQGKETASGETFNQHEATAAHPSLPLGSEAKVTNLKTGESTKVEITDRGPYAKGRDIDLSKQAAKEVGMTKEGVAPVKIEATKPAGKQTSSKCQK